MTERRLSTEDFAAHRPEGAIVPQAGETRDERYDTTRDDITRDGTTRDDTAVDASGGLRGTDGYRDGVPAAEGHDWNNQAPAQHDTVDRDAVDHDTTDRDTFDRDTTESGSVGHERLGEDPLDDDRADREPVEPSAVSTTAGDAPLFGEEDSANYQAEWRALQAGFVDDPREAVQRADELVAQVIQNLATTFAAHKSSLEGQWQQGGQVDTEELRQALKRYRSFFDRLLSV
ncbi:hypothetical protein ACFV4N_30445 [Actinosynnema sp. NPDC059797]